MSIGPGHSGYDQLVELIGVRLLAAIPPGSPHDLAINALLNATTTVLERATKADPKFKGTDQPGIVRYRAEKLSRGIVFLIGEALRLGVDLDDLGRYCQQLATDRERKFFDAKVT